MLKQFVVFCIITIGFTGCSTLDKTEIQGIMEQFKTAGFEVKLDQAAKSGKARSLTKKQDQTKTKIMYKLTLKKDDITKKITITDFHRDDLQRNLYNLRNAVSNARNNYHVLNNDTLVLTIFSFDYEKEKEFVESAKSAFMKYKRK